MDTRSFSIAVGCLLVMSVGVHGVDTAVVIDRAGLSARAHRTWEGTYTFSEEDVLCIANLPDLHVLIYRHAGNEGTLIEFAEVASEGTLRLLSDADASVKGVTPTLEGVDVLPAAEEAEIIVRWRHPGQGGWRSVRKYRYSPGLVELTAGSDLVRDGRKMKWVKAESFAPSTPAELSPQPPTP
ncbi:hypothetical protein JXA88_14805 [Candidatus Fermentibacteria bacterium]|nr:hypothetical protein [Candidatus Fermentibacteria bacterium]